MIDRVALLVGKVRLEHLQYGRHASFLAVALHVGPIVLKKDSAGADDRIVFI